MTVETFGTWSAKDNCYICSKCSGKVIFDWMNENVLRCTNCDTSMAPYGMCGFADQSKKTNKYAVDIFLFLFYVVIAFIVIHAFMDRP